MHEQLLDEPLLVAPCPPAAVTFAVRNWHYSRVVPAGGRFARGVWEHGRFVGVIVFSRGATYRLGSPWGLEQTECVELSRVALDRHEHPVTQMVARAIRDLHATSPGLRLIVSFADPKHGHHGGIYQAGNWIYTGANPTPPDYVVRGTRMHPRSVGARGWRQSIPWLREHVDPHAHTVPVPPKHRYVYPLDGGMRRVALRQALPYPAPAGEGST